MQREPAPEQGTVQTALAEWRQKAVSILAAATAVAYLPPLVLFIAGRGPEFAWLVRAILIGAYTVTILCVVLRRADYRRRAWALMAAAYVLMIAGNIANPQGTFVRAMPVVLPMLMMVLFGARVGRAATVVSIVILLLAPFVHTMPSLVGILTLEPSAPPIPPHVILFQGTALVSLLAAPMILLERFHRFLIRSLSALERESGERAVACCRLEREILERRRLEREIAHVSDEERRRLGLDIHDGVCQELTGALLRSEALARSAERGEAATPMEFAAISGLIENAIDEAHAVARGLCLLDPDPEALASELRTLARRTQNSTGIVCHLSTTGDVAVPDPTLARHLFRIAQEALSNAVRHAHPSQISLELAGTENALLLQIEDNGDGMPKKLGAGHMGLYTMASRADMLGGVLALIEVPGGGTRVSCRVPREDNCLAGALQYGLHPVHEEDHG